MEGRQETNFYEYREDGILLAISVTDSLTDGISAVYNFYDPELTSRGLGIFMILSLIGDNKAEQEISLHRVLDKRMQEDELQKPVRPLGTLDRW